MLKKFINGILLMTMASAPVTAKAENFSPFVVQNENEISESVVDYMAVRADKVYWDTGVQILTLVSQSLATEDIDRYVNECVARHTNINSGKFEGVIILHILESGEIIIKPYLDKHRIDELESLNYAEQIVNQLESSYEQLPEIKLMIVHDLVCRVFSAK